MNEWRIIDGLGQEIFVYRKARVSTKKRYILPTQSGLSNSNLDICAFIIIIIYSYETLLILDHSFEQCFHRSIALAKLSSLISVSRFK